MASKKPAAASAKKPAAAARSKRQAAVVPDIGQVKKRSAPTRSSKIVNGKKPTAAQAAAAPSAALVGPAPITSSRKRKMEDEPAPSVFSSPKRRKAGEPLSVAPTRKLDVYVFGSGESGELGLGNVVRNKKKPTNVTRPRLNDLLDASTVGVVQMAVGGMHCVALTHDGKVLTWGVNDNGALGRDTTWEAPTKDIDAASDSDEDSDDDDDSGLNPRESTPTAISDKYFKKGDGDLVQVAATDSASFALTSKGLVYGWGTFSGSDGIIGFSKTANENTGQKIQKTPTLIPQLKNITSLAAGGNHMLALDAHSAIYAWGCGQQHQLGRPIMERYRTQALVPSLVRIPRAKGQGKVSAIAAGQFHSFALTTTGQIYAWGLNNFAQTGISPPKPTDDAAGTDGEQQDPASLIVPKPKLVEALLPGSASIAGAENGTGSTSKTDDADAIITALAGGNHHSLALTSTGRVLSWGRCDGSQAGLPLTSISPTSHLIFDSRGRARILSVPTRIPALEDVDIGFIATGIDNSIVVAQDGRVFSWGFGANYRTGLGDDEEREEPVLVENSAVRGRKMRWVGCGGQFGVLAGLAGEMGERE